MSIEQLQNTDAKRIKYENIILFTQLSNEGIKNKIYTQRARLLPNW